MHTRTSNVGAPIYPSFSEGTGRRRAGIIFSKTRQGWIRDFKDMTQLLPEDYGRCGSAEWIKKLLEYLQGFQAEIQTEDLNRWMGKYPWIKQGIVVDVPSAEAFRPDPAMNNSAQDQRPRMTAVLVGSARNSSQSNSPTGAGVGVNQQIRGETPKKELLKRYDAIRDRIVELEEMTEDLPEFRAVIPAFNTLARVVGRNYRQVVSRKRREEVLHEDLAREGVPHVVRGFKREKIEVPMELMSDSDVDFFL